MAENETLDIRCSSRWRKPLEALRRRAPTEEVADLLRESLADCWGKVRREFRKGGFSLEEVLDAAIDGDHAFLNRAYRELHYHKFVELIRRSAGFMENREQIMESAMRQHLRMTEQQMRDVLARDSDAQSVSDASRRTDEAFSEIRRDASTFAQSFVEKPRAARQKLCSNSTYRNQSELGKHAAIYGLSIMATIHGGNGVRP